MKFQALLLAGLGILLSCSILSAQNIPQQKGLTISAGVGVLPTFLGENAKTAVPPVSLRIGYNFSRRFNLSGYFGFTDVSTKPKLFSDGLASQNRNQFTVTGLRAEIRQEISKKFNLYGGAMLGYSHSKLEETDPFTGQAIVRDPEAPTPYDPNAPKGQVIYAGFVGAHYFFQKKLGVFAELGYGISIVNLGLTIRL